MEVEVMPLSINVIAGEKFYDFDWLNLYAQIYIN